MFFVPVRSVQVNVKLCCSMSKCIRNNIVILPGTCHPQHVHTKSSEPAYKNHIRLASQCSILHSTVDPR